MLSGPAALEHGQMVDLQPFELVDIFHVHDHVCRVNGGNLPKRVFILKVKNRHLFFLHDK
ncbi:hypothetical protein D3C76_1478840 [compost metagenome]